MEYPRLVYRSAEDYRIVHNTDQHAALVGNGWYDSVTDAINPPVVKRAAKKPAKGKQPNELD